MPCPVPISSGRHASTIADCDAGIENAFATPSIVATSTSPMGAAMYP